MRRSVRVRSQDTKLASLVNLTRSVQDVENSTRRKGPQGALFGKLVTTDAEAVS